MIANIIDKRSNSYKWKKLDAIIEATRNDNSCEGADQAKDTNAPVYDERVSISLAEAIRWGQSISGEVTLFLYDPNSIDRTHNEQTNMSH